MAAASDATRPVGPANGPWREADFSLPAELPTMISREEVRYLHWLTREFWSGEGDVVEFGPWLGGSTYCLAAGMRANGGRAESSRLHVIDNFRWQQFMGTRAPLDLAPGASFRGEFERNLSTYADLLAVHEARLPDEPIVEIEFGTPLGQFDLDLPLFDSSMLDRRLEIVFVDGAKSWRALVHMLRQLSPHCVPGSTVLVFQDLKVTGGYWVQMGAAKLLGPRGDGLEPLHLLPFNSIAFRLAEGFDPGALEALPDSIDAISPAQGIDLLASVSTHLEAAGDTHASRLVALSGVVFLGSKGEWDEAVARFRAVERGWPLGESGKELNRVRRWLVRNPPGAVPASLRSRSRDGYARARARAAALRRRFGG